MSDSETDSETNRAALVGIDRVAIGVDGIDEALAFYGDPFAFELRSRSDSSAFLDTGDQFLALSANPDAETMTNGHRYVGLVVDDADAVARRLDDGDIDRLDAPGVEFRNPW